MSVGENLKPGNAVETATDTDVSLETSAAVAIYLIIEKTITTTGERKIDQKEGFLASG